MHHLFKVVIAILLSTLYKATNVPTFFDTLKLTQNILI
ncbi:hypothetical protein P20429_1036 [Pseudoalteromonas sp. BSi20429]|uniref:Uncharacterized protein n=1 Tax=Pseudoalteromonas arctica A 37-1-2 TaxID=1117313 RepID=A0A290S094_9GAMM|nr:hypothetical protein PARC_a0941 [Pseudoalteromonas arctica A 37-1-2]GAA66922.1 hypothetical protein P20429_1036 [Pseudoalteromonas sp. BSi20429]